MINETIFIPKILLRGDREEFFSRVGELLYKIVGQIKFHGEINGRAFNFLSDGKFLLNDKLLGYTELPKIMRGGD